MIYVCVWIVVMTIFGGVWWATDTPNPREMGIITWIAGMGTLMWFLLGITGLIHLIFTFLRI